MSTGAVDETVRGWVFDIQRMSIHDGPGIRTTVFLKGCPLECAWCHNPEGHARRPQLAFTPSLCIGCGFCFKRCPNEAHIMDGETHRLLRDVCTACFTCVEECYSNALEVVGKEMSAREVLDEVIKDKPFYDESKGGLTVSGGEPIDQFDFTRAILSSAKAQGLDTCLETCGFGPPDRLAQLVPLVGLFLFDYKETDPERHRASTGQPSEPILENLRLLDEQGAAIILRCPIIPSINQREDHYRGIVAQASCLHGCRGIHIMGYHALGESKRERLGLPPRPRFPDLERAGIEAVVARVRELGGRDVTAT